MPRYQVWLQTGDETLDYRLAQQYYRACALRIQAGGDHGSRVCRAPAGAAALPALAQISIRRSISILTFAFTD
jgi:hypothetical protein